MDEKINPWLTVASFLLNGLKPPELNTVEEAEPRGPWKGAVLSLRYVE